MSAAVRNLFVGMVALAAMGAAFAPNRQPIMPFELPEPPLPALSKDLKVNVQVIADLFRQGRAQSATKFAEKAAPTVDDFYELANLYRQRNKVGFGWGQPGQFAVNLDGLERIVSTIARGAPPQLLTNPQANIEAADRITALAEMTIALAPKKDRPRGHTRAAWLGWSEQLKNASLEFRKAAANQAEGMKIAATKIMGACNNCHIVFRE